MATKADLKRASAALQSLRNNRDALRKLDLALTELKHDLGVDMDEETFRYVVNALVNQKVVADADPVAGKDKVRLPGGFQILASIEAAAQ